MTAGEDNFCHMSSFWGKIRLEIRADNSHEKLSSLV